MSAPAGSVWLDARGIQSIGHAGRGIARLVLEQAIAIVETGGDAIGWIGLDSNLPIPPEAQPLVDSGKVAWDTESPEAGREAPAVFHAMSPFEADIPLDRIWPPWMRDGGTRLAVTLYDLIPLVMREQYAAQWGSWATAWIARLGLMGSADQVQTISENTARDAVEHLAIPWEKITVAGVGVSDTFSSQVTTREEAEAALRATAPKANPGFLLYVGGEDYRKNMEGTVRAYSLLPEEIRRERQLLLVCSPSPLRKLELKQYARSLDIESGQMLLAGGLSDRELAALYRTCGLFIFPSLYEGAGLPILEAMSCDAPVAASNTSSIPELLGDLDATFDPADPADMAAAIRAVLEAPGELDRLRERSRRQVRIHTWTAVAERSLESYEKALAVSV
jgi:glycosyltransferase involved in cell wall biosynthesis